MRSTIWKVSLAFSLVASIAACGSSAGSSDDTSDRLMSEGTTGSASGGAEARVAEEAAQPPGEGWPRVLVTGPGTGPALYLGNASSAPGVGYLNPGVRVRLESAPINGRVQVLVGGGLATKGWVPLSRLGGYAQERGRVEGTRAYLAPGDFVSIQGPAETAGQMRIEARPWLGGTNFISPTGEEGFVGTFDASKISDRPPEGDVEGVSPGECFRLPAGQTVAVTERPNGETLAILPALDPPLAVTVLRQRDDLFGVRAGYGPYLTGYVRGALTPCDGAAPTPEPAAPSGDGERPYWMSQETGNLYRVASGTAIGSHDRAIARLRTEGWARELGRQEGGLVDCFIAVDDGVAIRGLVRESHLTLVEEGTTSTPTPEEGDDEELPDELQ